VDDRPGRRRGGLARDIGYDLGLLSLGASGRPRPTSSWPTAAGWERSSPSSGSTSSPRGRPAPRRALLRRFSRSARSRPSRWLPSTATTPRRRARARRERPWRGGGPLHGQRRLDHGRPALSLRAARSSLPVRFAGGLLGQWAVWTRRAVELLQEVKECRRTGQGAFDLLALGQQLTDANSALFDAATGSPAASRESTSPAAPGAARREMVPRPARGPLPGRRRRSIASSRPTPISPTTSSSRRTSRDG